MGRVQEVIEIGALLLDRYGEVQSSFSRFVQPVLHPVLSPFCRELTSIEQRQVDRASTFPVVIEDFQDWGELFDEEYLLCAWGGFDQRMLIQDCELHDMEHDWLEPYINLKEQYRQIKGLHRTIGLKKAVRKEGFEFTGIHHRGISDAENLAKVFAKYLDEWQF